MAKHTTFSSNSAPTARRIPAAPGGIAAPPRDVEQAPRTPVDVAAALSTARRDLWARTGGGLAFMLAGTLLWTGLGIVGIASADTRSAALVYLWATGLVFPLALVIGRLLGHDVLTRANPLAMLGPT
jgi:hypothetical protein